MFLNRDAIITLVKSDPAASDREKKSVVAAMSGDGASFSAAGRAVVSFKDAAQILGYSGKRGVYRALHDGVLTGFYGGKHQQRCTGITMESIQRALLGKNACRTAAAAHP